MARTHGVAATFQFCHEGPGGKACDECRAALREARARQRAKAPRTAPQQQAVPSVPSGATLGTLIEAAQRFRGPAQPVSSAVSSPVSSAVSSAPPEGRPRGAERRAPWTMPRLWPGPYAEPPWAADHRKNLAQILRDLAAEPSQPQPVFLRQGDDQSKRDHKTQLKDFERLLREFKAANPGTGFSYSGERTDDYPMLGLQYQHYVLTIGTATAAEETRAEPDLMAPAIPGLSAALPQPGDEISPKARFDCQNNNHAWHETPMQPVRRCIHCPATEKALWVRRQEADYAQEAQEDT
jgi:hypothetical protein